MYTHGKAGGRHGDPTLTCGRLLCDVKISSRELIRCKSYDLKGKPKPCKPHSLLNVNIRGVWMTTHYLLDTFCLSDWLSVCLWRTACVCLSVLKKNRLFVRRPSVCLSVGMHVCRPHNRLSMYVCMLPAGSSFSLHAYVYCCLSVF